MGIHARFVGSLAILLAGLRLLHFGLLHRQRLFLVALVLLLSLAILVVFWGDLASTVRTSVLPVK
jgi:hypothetical protein